TQQTMQHRFRLIVRSVSRGDPVTVSLRGDARQPVVTKVARRTFEVLSGCPSFSGNVDSFAAQLQPGKPGSLKVLEEFANEGLIRVTFAAAQLVVEMRDHHKIRGILAAKHQQGAQQGD